MHNMYALQSMFDLHVRLPRPWLFLQAPVTNKSYLCGAIVFRNRRIAWRNQNGRLFIEAHSQQFGFVAGKGRYLSFVGIGSSHHIGNMAL